jgi:HTH-type transcriptional regulator/antitoxin HigA
MNNPKKTRGDIMPKAKTKIFKPERARYMELIQQLPLRPIRTDDEHDVAIAMIDSLSDRKSLTGDEHDYMLVLAKLIEDYEDDREPTAEASPREILRELLKSNNINQAKLAEETGIAESTISDILAGRRPISRKAMYTFAKRFSIDPGLFV